MVFPGETSHRLSYYSDFEMAILPLTRIPEPATPGVANIKQPATFDYTSAVWKTGRHICAHVDELRHVDMELIAVDYTRCRNSNDHGTLAR